MSFRTPDVGTAFDTTCGRARDPMTVMESCFCGWTGELAERAPVIDERGNHALRCRGCGHVDDLSWLGPAGAARLWEKATLAQRQLLDGPSRGDANRAPSSG